MPTGKAVRKGGKIANTGWTAKEKERRDAILRSAAELGCTRRGLAAVIGHGGAPGDVLINRWAKGEAKLLPSEMKKMEDHIASLVSVKPDTLPGADSAHGTLDVPITSGSVLTALMEHAAGLAGDDVDSKDEEKLKKLARKHRPVAFGTLLQLMVGARSSAIRLRAAEVVLERSDGKAVQATVDLTPRQPFTHEQLVEALETAVKGAEKKP